MGGVVPVRLLRGRSEEAHAVGILSSILLKTSPIQFLPLSVLSEVPAAFELS